MRYIFLTAVLFLFVAPCVHANSLEAEKRKIATERKKLNERRLQVLEESLKFPIESAKKGSKIRAAAEEIKRGALKPKSNPTDISIKRIRHNWRKQSNHSGVVDFSVYYANTDQSHVSQLFEFINTQMKRRKHIGKSEFQLLPEKVNGYPNVLNIRFVDLPAQAIF